MFLQRGGRFGFWIKIDATLALKIGSTYSMASSPDFDGNERKAKEMTIQGK